MLGSSRKAAWWNKCENKPTKCSCFMFQAHVVWELKPFQMVFKTRCSGAASGGTYHVARERNIQPRESCTSAPAQPKTPGLKVHRIEPNVHSVTLHGIVNREHGGRGQQRTGEARFIISLPTDVLSVLLLFQYVSWQDWKFNMGNHWRGSGMGRKEGRKEGSRSEGEERRGGETWEHQSLSLSLNPTRCWNDYYTSVTFCSQVSQPVLNLIRGCFIQNHNPFKTHSLLALEKNNLVQIQLPSKQQQTIGCVIHTQQPCHRQLWQAGKHEFCVHKNLIYERDPDQVTGVQLAEVKCGQEKEEEQECGAGRCFNIPGL